MNKNDDIEFQIVRTRSSIDYRKYQVPVGSCNSILVKTHLRCRHSNSVKYLIYVLLGKSKIGLEAALNAHATAGLANRWSVVAPTQQQFCGYSVLLDINFLQTRLG